MNTKYRNLARTIRIAVILALSVMIYFVIMTIVIPVYRFEITPPKDASKDIFQPDLNWQLSAPDSIQKKTVELAFGEAYLLSRLKMTETDSISLSVNLKDSLVSLIVQGVTIYSTKIQTYNVSNAFSRIDPFILAQWLSVPFVVDTFFASTVKIPVLYKKAPKDTIEAMNQLEMNPFKDNLDPMYFRLNLDRKIILSFKQVEEPEKETINQLRNYKRALRRNDQLEIFKNLSRFTPIEFKPRIEIGIDKKAGRVIYRAIPVRSLVSIRLN